MFDQLKHMMHSRNVLKNKYFTFQENKVVDCVHDRCNCRVDISSVHPLLNGYRYVIYYASLTQDVLEWIVDFCQRYPTTYVGDLAPEAQEELHYILSSMTHNKNIKIIMPQTDCQRWPESSMIGTYNTALAAVAQNADKIYYNRKGILTDHQWHNVWGKEVLSPDATLTEKILHGGSIYNMVFGTYKGFSRFIHATEKLYPRKWSNAIIRQERNVRVPIDAFKYVWNNVPIALDYLYTALGTYGDRAQHNVPLTFADLSHSYMGSSAGLKRQEKTKDKRDGFVFVRTTEGKKLENIEADVRAIMNLLKHDICPEVIWRITEKVETFVSDKEPSQQEEWRNKVRIYVIPSSVYIIGERLVSNFRMILERRSGHIRIGRGWSYGGAQMLMEQLGLSLDDLWLAIIVEGDVSNFDQSVIAHFVDLYFSRMLFYENPTTVSYRMRKKILVWLARHIVTRITHLVGKLWAALVGGVPSGCFNTSHMDSWIMLLWLVLWVVHLIFTTSDMVIVEKLEKWLLKLLAAVYGDDHCWNTTNDKDLKELLSAGSFQHFMKTYMDVTIRDSKTLPFLSEPDGRGGFKSKGLTSLKYQFVMNPWRDRPNQPLVLPYRKTQELVIKCVVGTKSTVRGPRDVILSSIGQAYGTYASNVHAYDCLKALYEASLRIIGTEEGASLQNIVDTMSRDQLKSYRRKGITREELLAGFPSMETLIKKNELDRAYHSRTSEFEEFNEVLS